MVGRAGVEPTTPALSEQCSNQLSYLTMSRVVYRDTSSLFHICKRFELFIGSDPKRPGQMIWSVYTVLPRILVGPDHAYYFYTIHWICGLKVECAFPHLKPINSRDKFGSPLTTVPCRLVLICARQNQ